MLHGQKLLLNLIFEPRIFEVKKVDGNQTPDALDLDLHLDLEFEYYLMQVENLILERRILEKCCFFVHSVMGRLSFSAGFTGSKKSILNIFFS